MIVKHGNNFRHKVYKTNYLGYNRIQLQRRWFIFWIDCIFNEFAIRLEYGRKNDRFHINPSIMGTAFTFNYEVWDGEDFDINERLRDDLRSYLKDKTQKLNQDKKLSC